MTTEQTLQIALESMARVNEAQSLQLEVQSYQLEILTEQNAEMAQRIKELTAQIAWFQRQMFGRKSEKRLVFEGQPSLLGDELVAPKADEQDEETEETAAGESKGAGERSRKPAKRPRQTFPFWRRAPSSRKAVWT